MSFTLQVSPQGCDRTAAPASLSYDSSLRTAVADAQPHVPRMLLVARRILGSDDLAWDAVQEALILLWHERDTPPDLVGWLVRTVVHRSLHQARTQRRRRAHEDAFAANWARSTPPADPSREIEVAELEALVARALAALPEPFQSVVRLRDVEELEYAHIAARLALPVGTVRSRLHRGRAWLRAQLAELVHDASECWICTDEGNH